MKNKLSILSSGWRLAASLVLLAVALPMAAFAQETTSSIRGKVRDASGQPVANADVVVTNMRNGVSYNYTSNSGGTFLASNLPVGGPYRVAVAGARTVEVPSISLGDTYNLAIELSSGEVEEIVVTGQAVQGVDVAAGPSATFSSYDIETSVNFNRDIVDVYTIDPRINLDNEDDGAAINCGGKHPRFNSVTLDGVSQDDRFGLNENGYSTAVGMPFPFDAIEQVAVELAPFDVTYGGFSACNINAVTKSGSNEWTGNVFYEYTSDSLRGDTLGVDDNDYSTPAYDKTTQGFSIGGPILRDRLFIFGAYEKSEEPRFLARGYDGSGNGDERDWLSQADYNRINDIAGSVYNYEPGGLPGDGVQEAEKYMARVDWNINDSHNLALIYNYFDGFQDRDSDGGSNEFEFANHFYTKGSESETTTLKLFSQWTDELSTEVFYSHNEMNDSQVTVGPKDFGDFQIDIGNNTVYMGADDSRQANALNTESDFFKLSGQYLVGDHVITAGFEREELTIFNQFVQHSRGGEWDFHDDSIGDPAACQALTAQGRFDDPDCGLSGIDKFELGRPDQVYYGSGGGTNDAADAAAQFTNTLNSLYVQDEYFFDQYNLTIVAGLRYDFFESSDQPNFNSTFAAANGGLRNDANVDGLSLLMPRLGFTWEAREDVTVRGGVGLYSGGNPNVWISNAWSNDGLTNVQLSVRNPDSANSVLDGTLDLIGDDRPGYDVPQSLYDQVAAVTPDNAVNRGLVLIDPSYKQPREWKFALGATYDLPWGDVVADIDYLHTKQDSPAIYVDLSQSIVGETIIGQPIYDFTNGQDNLMLTNSHEDGSSDLFSIALRKDFEWGLDLMAGYAYTDAEDVNPMTSAVAVSNWENLATNDVNNPSTGTSNYVVPQRFTFRASYGHEFFGDNTTRFTLFAYSSEGQPQSFVMGSGDLEGDGFFGRHLLYVPTGPADPNVQFASSFQTDEFFSWVDREGLSPGLQERNAQNSKWSSRVDLRISQEFPAFIGDVKGRAFIKVYNLGNLMNDDWGIVNDAQFFSVQVVNSSVDPGTGQYIFENFTENSINDVLENRSLWEVRFGIEVDF